MKLSVNNVEVDVEWEDNAATRGLHEAVQTAPISVTAHRYDGVEQVGALPRSFPRTDTNMHTRAGDIVLYGGDHLVTFFNSHSWSYTKLGRITGRTHSDLVDLLDVPHATITLTASNSGN
ncbi:hypothetical protein H8R18_06340 [Nanchangia anserum]|uniref:Cyclophilin-like domain-containing protein n=1 Tax=Nanchangia anserum TaxID=2692125 RepID=A0A8I0KNC9_9ACTO|nr:cyclophilin-like fold protein [Nanchangia anserum]MBD3689151.1 hypothetical protein [Nanchangia anserum]QOX81383.1 hypothetical protein H8R18_06340 [Nanchangia anserum]